MIALSAVCGSMPTSYALKLGRSKVKTKLFVDPTYGCGNYLLESPHAMGVTLCYMQANFSRQSSISFCTSPPG